MSNLIELAERCERGSGSDGRLCAEIACALIFKDLRPAEPDDFGGKYGYCPHNIKVDTGFLMADSYTTSLDASIALLERVLPGWEWTVRTNAGRFSANAWNHEIKWECSSGGSSPARALLAAILKALAAKDPNHG